MPPGVDKIFFGNGLFVGVGQYLSVMDRQYVSHAIIYTSIDGMNWTSRFDGVGPLGNQFNAVAFGGGRILSRTWLHHEVKT